MTCTFRLADRHLLFIVDDVEKQSRPIDASAIATFKDWAARYGRCVRDDRPARSVSLDALLAIGREIAAWLDQMRWMASRTGAGGCMAVIRIGTQRLIRLADGQHLAGCEAEFGSAR